MMATEEINYRNDMELHSLLGYNYILVDNIKFWVTIIVNVVLNLIILFIYLISCLTSCQFPTHNAGKCGLNMGPFWENGIGKKQEARHVIVFLLCSWVCLHLCDIKLFFLMVKENTVRALELLVLLGWNKWGVTVVDGSLQYIWKLYPPHLQSMKTLHTTIW